MFSAALKISLSTQGLNPQTTIGKQCSLNGYLQETKAAIEDPKLITSTASSTGPGMNGPPKLFNKRPSQLNVNVPGGFHTLQDFAPFG